MLDWPNEWTIEMVNKDVGLALRKDGLPSGLCYCRVML